MRILLIEDELPLAKAVSRYLQGQGHTVLAVLDGVDGLHEAIESEPDLVLLDLTLPGLDGLEVLRGIRRRNPSLPVIVMTARASVDQRVTGLDLGADDYFVKPFALAELGARVRSSTRSRDQPDSTRIDFGDLHLDLKCRQVHRGDREIHLTAREFALLAYLARHPGQVLTRDQLMAAVWDVAHDPESRVLEVYIGYLRRKLRVDGAPDLIETVRQVGYRLRDRQAAR